MYIFFQTYFCYCGAVKKNKKKQMILFVNEKNFTNWYLGKNSIKKMKKRLKTPILVENNQPAPQCLAKRKNTDIAELIRKCIKVPNTLRRVKLEFLKEPETVNLGFRYLIIRINLTLELSGECIRLVVFLRGIYIYIYIFFSLVKPESGIIPSGQLNYSNFEHLNLLVKSSI